MKFVWASVFAAILCSSTTAAADQEFKIGVLAPLSGEGARSYGQQIKNGILLAKRQQASGKISLVFEDSACDVKTAITAAKKLITIDKVQAIIGDACWTDLIAPFAERYRIPVIAPGSAQSSVREAGDFIFRLKLDVAVDSRALAQTLREHFNYRSAAVIYVGDQWGEGISRNFSKAFSEAGGAVPFTALFERNERDFRPVLLKLKGNPPEMLMLAGYPENIGILAKQVRELGLSIPLAAYRGGLAEESLELAGGAIEGLLYLEEFDADAREESRAFARQYQSTYGHGANLFGAMGFDAYNLFRVATETCGTDTTCIKDSLYKVKDFAGVSGVITFDSFGDVVKPLALFTIADGKFVPYRSSLLADAKK